MRRVEIGKDETSRDWKIKDLEIERPEIGDYVIE